MRIHLMSRACRKIAGGRLAPREENERLLDSILIKAFTLVRFARGEEWQQSQRRGRCVRIGRARRAARIARAMTGKTRKAPTPVRVAMAIEPIERGRDGDFGVFCARA